MAGLAEILAENTRLRESLAAAKAALELTQAERDAAVSTAEHLARTLELLRLEASGPRSQRFVASSAGQVELFTDEVPPPPPPRVAVPDEPSDEDESEVVVRPKAKPRRRTREDFDHLDREPVHCNAGEVLCRGCGAPMKVFATASSFRVEWVPGRFVRHDIVREKCSCPSCPGEGVWTAPGPYALDRCLAGNGLVARVIVDKFGDHIPANRQAKRMAREGLEVGSHTVSSWLCKAGEVLEPLADAVRAQVLEGARVQGDDTGLPIQDGGDGKLRKGRMWAFTDQDQVFYAFTPTKHGEFPEQLLEGFVGDLILVDGGSEFNRAVRTHELKRAGCWSHLRTYFFKALPDHPTEAGLALGTLHDLFMIERSIWGRPPDEVLAERQARSRSLVDGFYAWARARSTYARPESTLGKALAYTLNQEEAMRLFLEHGELPIHNNLSELMLRQTVVGRKNWLFARSEGGAKAAATLYTLIGSSQLQGLDPWAYLVNVLARVQDYPAKRVGELTPREWRAPRERHTVA